MTNGMAVRIGLVAVVAFVAGSASVFAQDKGRVTSVGVIMKAIHKPHSGGIGDLLKGDGPKDDAAWQQMLLHAAMLNESGHLLMQNDRCPSKVWAEATGTLRAGATAVHEAAGNKDVEAARAAFKTMTSACAACHKAHRNPLPDRFANVHALMAGINQPNCGAIGKAIKGDGPADDKAWQTLLMQAALLNEAGHILMQNERCPDAVWSNAASSLRKASHKVALAAKGQDLAGVKKAFGDLTKSCGACHKAHKK
jgi:cytochrome c556